jgi:hypothetical protein
MLRQGVSKLIVAHAIAANIAMMDPDLPMIVSPAWLREHHVARLLFTILDSSMVVKRPV